MDWKKEMASRLYAVNPQGAPLPWDDHSPLDFRKLYGQVEDLSLPAVSVERFMYWRAAYYDNPFIQHLVKDAGNPEEFVDAVQRVYSPLPDGMEGNINMWIRDGSRVREVSIPPDFSNPYTEPGLIVGLSGGSLNVITGFGITRLFRGRWHYTHSVGTELHAVLPEEVSRRLAPGTVFRSMGTVLERPLHH